MLNFKKDRVRKAINTHALCDNLSKGDAGNLAKAQYWQQAMLWILGIVFASVCFLPQAWATRGILKIDEDCIISVLNRTVQAQENGDFDLPNVPSTMGQVRARATCVRGGLTIAGETEYFTVVNGGNTDVGVFYTGGESNIPQQLIITNDSPVILNSVGAVARLQVLARFSNGLTKDVSAGVTGINYRSSNEQIAIVDTNGRITAVSAGTVLITARKDGAIAVIRVNVVLSGDLDGDGIPDK